MPALTIIAVLPILPSLIGLLSLIPAFLAGGLTMWRLRTESANPRLSTSVWRRFWLRQIPSLLVLTSLALLLRYAWGTWNQPATQAAPHNVAASYEQWTMARADLIRSGRSDRIALPRARSMERVWEFRPPGTIFYGDPLPLGNFLYVVGSRENVGTIYALSQDTGELIWSCRPDGYRETLSSPVAANNILYVGEGLHYDRNARLIAISLAGPQTGDVLWTYPVQGHLECTPILVKDRIFLAAGDDGIYCLSIEDRRAKPLPIWHVTGERIPDVDISLAYHNDRLYVGSGNGGQALVVLDALSGQEVDRWRMPAPVRGLPTIHDGRIAFASGDGDFKSLGTSPGHLTLRCLSGSSPCKVHEHCQPVIQIPLPSIVLGAMVVANETLYCGCSDGTVRRFDFDGNLKGSWSSGAPIAGSLLTDGETLVIHNRDGWMFGLDSKTLQQLWAHRLGSPGYYVSSPVAAQGRIFVGTDSDGVICLGRDQK